MNWWEITLAMLPVIGAIGTGVILVLRKATVVEQAVQKNAESVGALGVEIAAMRERQDREADAMLSFATMAAVALDRTELYHDRLRQDADRD